MSLLSQAYYIPTHSIFLDLMIVICGDEDTMKLFIK
jgi:hypothetical protein